MFFFIEIFLIFTRYCNIRDLSIYEQFINVESKNIGYDTLKYKKILNGESELIQTSEDLSPNYMVLFNYAPIIFVDVERSFSRYKNVFTK
jgi:hypothetical protein